MAICRPRAAGRRSCATSPAAPRHSPVTSTRRGNWAAGRAASLYGRTEASQAVRRARTGKSSTARRRETCAACAAPGRRSRPADLAATSRSSTHLAETAAGLDRAANLLGAMSLVIADQATDAVAETAGRSESGAAALSALLHFLDRPSID